MSFQITLLPQQWRFTAAAGQSLRAAASDAGIVLPSSCRNGTCRTCIGQLQSGEVRHAIEWPGLSAEEKQQGWILPCVATALSDLSLLLPTARKADVPG